MSGKVNEGEQDTRREPLNHGQFSHATTAGQDCAQNDKKRDYKLRLTLC